MTVLVAAAIIQKDGKFLIARRAPHKHLGGLWEFPGGKIEKNETPEDCLHRELNEELRVKVEIIRFLIESTHNYGDVKISLKAYLCNFIEGDFTLIDHDQIRWVSLSEMKRYTLAPADIPLVKALVNSLGS